MLGTNTVDTRHPDYNRRLAQYELVSDCVDGEDAMKARGTRYLPRPDGWSDNRYSGYVKRACFMNATGRTRAALVGIAMAKPASVELTPAFEYFRDDADGQGKSLIQTYRDGLTNNLTHGRGGILLDSLTIGAGAETTIAAAASNRFVLRNFSALNIINWRRVNGKMVLLVLEYKEDGDDDGFQHTDVTRWIELRLVNGLCYGRLWSRSDGATLASVAFNSQATEASELVAIIINGVHLDFIPFSWYGAENNDDYPDVPPLADIAALNRGHFQNDADVSDAANLAGKPTLAATGLSEAWARDFNKDGIAIGGEEGVLLPIGGDLKIVQANETTMSAAQQERREKQMAMLGAKMVERGTGARTATQAGDEAQTDNSVLSQCAANVEEAINVALRWAGEAGTITVNKKFEAAAIDAQALTAMIAAVQGGYLLLTDFIRWQQNQGIADEARTPQDIEDELRNQEPVGMAAITAAAAQAQIDAVKNGQKPGADEESEDENKDEDE